jgi:hypothetical protein
MEQMMKIEQILDQWEADCKIDKTQLGDESIKVPKLHAKYSREFVTERIRLIHLKNQLKTLRFEKMEFLINPTQEGVQRGWKIPAQGRLLKADVANHLDSDPEIIEIETKVGIQTEKVELLKAIIDSLKTRGFLIKNCLDEIKWINGG